MSDAIKFPKTPRLVEVMREDEHQKWRRHTTVVEEKIDGANVGIWFDDRGQMKLQSRGHVLRGGASERQFAPLHRWAGGRREALHAALGTNYVLYGEWCFAKNKTFYDALPDLLLGFDVLDRRAGSFLPTSERDAVLVAAHVRGAPRLWSGVFGKAPPFGSFLGPSQLKTRHWRESLAREAARAGVDPMDETDDSDCMEGIYVRVEDRGVVGRMKLHREGYEKVRNDHWRRGRLIRNVLLTHC